MVKESSMRKITIKFFENEGYQCQLEVPILERKVDIIAKRADSIISIELKIKDWKKALEQALTCKIWSDFVYIGFWHEYIPNDIKLFKNYDIGILSISKNSVEVKLNPEKSKFIHPTLYESIANRY